MTMGRGREVYKGCMGAQTDKIETPKHNGAVAATAGRSGGTAMDTAVDSNGPGG